MLKFFCFHKFKDVDSDGYQYCKKCNKAVFVGLPEHNCIWKVIGKHSVHLFNNPNPSYYKYVMQCTICGEIKTETTT